MSFLPCRIRNCRSTRRPSDLFCPGCTRLVPHGILKKALAEGVKAWGSVQHNRAVVIARDAVLERLGVLAPVTRGMMNNQTNTKGRTK